MMVMISAAEKAGQQEKVLGELKDGFTARIGAAVDQAVAQGQTEVVVPFETTEANHWLVQTALSGCYRDFQALGFRTDYPETPRVTEAENGEQFYSFSLRLGWEL